VIRLALVIALCSSCTFSHGYAHRHDAAPTVTLSPKMQQLADEQSGTPRWAFIGDSLLMLGGFMAGPLADGRVDEANVQPINIGGFVVTGVMFASLGYTSFRWGL
jgi:hypothetical protein